MGKRDDLLSVILRSRIRGLIAAGYSTSAIAKIVNKSYQHTKRLVAQEAAEAKGASQ
jgi:hypothetical protein